MKTLHIITPSGNSQVDTIFAGVHGEIKADGQFDIAPELKAIHLFNLFNSKLLAEQGIDIMSNLAPIEINEDDEPAFKATMMASLKNRWLSAYDAVPVNGAFARASVLQERAMVDAAVTNALASINLPARDVSVESQFENAVTRLIFDDNGDDDVFGAEIFAGDVQSGLCRPWHVSSTPVTELPVGRVSTYGQDMHYASGTMTGTLNVHGNDGQIAGVLSALSQLPLTLKPPVSNVGFADLEWHQEPRHQNVQVEGLQLEAPAP